MERIANEMPPVIFGDGTQTMDFVYVENVAQANLLAAVSAASGELFNVGSGVETSLDELARRLLTAIGSCLAPVHAPSIEASPVCRRQANTPRARAGLRFDARVGLEEGLSRLVAWRRQVRRSLPSPDAP